MYESEFYLNSIENGYFSFIGKGSARYVYDLNNGYVAKVARNKKGFAQNEVEYMISMEEENYLLAKILYMYDDYKVIIMQKAERIESNRKLKMELKRAYGPHYFDEVMRLADRYDLLIGDMKRHSSWGMLEERPVLIDYGFTYEVRRKYY